MKKNFNIGRKDENVRWEYDVVYEHFFEYSSNFEKTVANLKERVNKKCSEGWIPEGAMSFFKFERDGSKYFCQTMIRPIVDSAGKESKISLSERPNTRNAYANLTMMNEF